MAILHQLEILFLAAAPTVVLFLLFYAFMRWAFFTPLQKTMAERAARIEGARTEAATVEAEAKHELDAYHEALRRARAEIYGRQEAARQAALENRAKLLKAMHARAAEEVAVAKKRIADDFKAALTDVEAQTSSLAQQIVRTILRSPSPTRAGVVQ
ncbi:MAG: ATP synthase F0 subunit B [Acidobacteriota bacterium]|nr:ATP synthase F0 subunit B [Acidobacteriota bacterium]